VEERRKGKERDAPVKIVWNAFSTFDASRADVSMLSKVLPVSPARKNEEPPRTTGEEKEKWIRNSQAQPVVLREQLRLLRRDRPQVPQIALVTNEHNDDVRVGVVPQLLEPAEDVDVGRVLGDVVDEEGTDRTAVVAEEEKKVSGERVRGGGRKGRTQK
jgi:hypothetical protein